jgi:excisionase family DNA binding protein
MKNVKFKIPALEVILNRLDKIDSQLESVLISKPQTEVWLSTKDAAKALGITTRTLQSYRDQGMIPYSQFGREIRYRQSDIQDFLLEHYVSKKKVG